MVSPIQILYEVKNASSIIKMQDSGISYGVNEECNVDKATEERGGEDQGSSSRDKQLELMTKLSAFLSHQIRVSEFLIPLLFPVFPFLYRRGYEVDKFAFIYSRLYFWGYISRIALYMEFYSLFMQLIILYTCNHFLRSLAWM